jgi:uncharacterized membrane protein YgcG
MRGSCFALGLALLVTACRREHSPTTELATTPAVANPQPATRQAPAEPPKLPFEVPALRGRVNDYANALTPEQETDLSGLYESVEREVGSQIALLTVESLNGVPIDDYSLTVANAWGLGRRGIDDGLLITIAFNDRKIRVEVGYGLELVISDQAAAEVIRRMGAEFSAGRPFAGIEAGSKELIQMIRANEALLGVRRQ